MGDREEGLVGEADVDFLMVGREDVFALSLMSDSDFFLDEDLAKKLFMDVNGMRRCRAGTAGV